MPVTDRENREAAWTEVAKRVRAVADRVMKPIV